MMRYFVFSILVIFVGTVAFAEKTPGLHDALSDCIHMITNPNDATFPNASEWTGDADQGFVAWYHDANEDPIYGTKLGEQGGVVICSGPAPMGPTIDHFVEFDLDLFKDVIKPIGLVELNVPAAGTYFANCGAPSPSLFLAIDADVTNRIGFKFISSPDVGGSCERFGVKD